MMGVAGKLLRSGMMLLLRTKSVFRVPYHQSWYLPCSQSRHGPCFSICSRVRLTDEHWYVYHQNEYSLTHNNDTILSYRQTEQQDYVMQVLKKESITVSSLGNAHHVRFFHIFINNFSMIVYFLSNLLFSYLYVESF